MPSFRLTPRAEADRDAIVKDGLPEWGKRRVEDYLDDLEACFEHLAAFPNMGTACDEIRRGYRCFPVEAHHVYYRIDETGVIIVRIHPQRMEKDAAILNEGNLE